MMDRKEELKQAFEAILELPEGYVQKTLMGAFIEGMSIRESSQFIQSQFNELHQDSVTDEVAKTFLVVFALYSAIGVDVDVPLAKMAPEMKDKLKLIEADLAEFGKLTGKILGTFFKAEGKGAE